MSRSVEETEALLERPYAPPGLLIFEEVELGGGYHTLHAAIQLVIEHDWSEPYTKTSSARYRNRIVQVPYPPRSDADVDDRRARQLIVGLGWESQLSSGDLDGLSPRAMRRAIAILEPACGDERIDQLSRYAIKILSRRLDALAACEKVETP